MTIINESVTEKCMKPGKNLQLKKNHSAIEFYRFSSGLNLKLILRNIWRNSSINHQRLPSIQACSYQKLLHARQHIYTYIRIKPLSIFDLKIHFRKIPGKQAKTQGGHTSLSNEVLNTECLNHLASISNKSSFTRCMDWIKKLLSG